MSALTADLSQRADDIPWGDPDHADIDRTEDYHHLSFDRAIEMLKAVGIGQISEDARQNAIENAIARGLRLPAELRIKIYDHILNGNLLTQAELKAAIQRLWIEHPSPDPEPEKSPSTEDALALLFSERYQDQARYVPEIGRWYLWSNEEKRWLLDSGVDAIEMARELLRQQAIRCDKPSKQAQLKAARTINAVERLARGDFRNRGRRDQWDVDPWLLGTPDGTVDLRSGELREPQREDFITCLTAARLAPSGSRAQTWLAFLDEVTNSDHELEAYLARVAGYCLTGSTEEQVLFFFYGLGNNGKSTFVRILGAILNDYWKGVPIEALLENRNERHPADIARLRGARLVTSVEVSKNQRWAEGKIKALTGGDQVTARLMRENSSDFLPQFKLMVAGNYRPALRAVDDAIRRRMHLIHFRHPILKVDKRFDAKLMTERDAILRWAVDGCLAWQKNGLCPPEAVREATEEYLGGEDLIGRWLDEACELLPTAESSTEELYRSWREWAEASGEPAGSKRRLADDLVRHGFKRWRDTRLRGFLGLQPRLILRG